MVVESFLGVSQSMNQPKPEQRNSDTLELAEERIVNSVVERTPQEQKIGDVERYVGLGAGAFCLVTWRLLSRPFVIFQRQCQVNRDASTSFSVFSSFSTLGVMANIASHQGSPSQWGGLGGELVVIGIQGVSENLLNESRYLPKSLSDVNGSVMLTGHLMNRCVSFLLSSPFYASSVVQSVQSHLDGGTPAVFDCIKSGVAQIFGYKICSRYFLSLYITAPVFVGYNLLQYCTEAIVTSCINRFTAWTHPEDSNGSESSILSVFYPQLLCGTISTAVSSVLLYPVQTVLHRLVVQGTQTVIDNTDTGIGCVPVHTMYSGFVDCWMTTIQEEGWNGLYKGFSSLLLQLVLGIAIVHAAKVVFIHFAEDSQTGKQQ